MFLKKKKKSKIVGERVDFKKILKREIRSQKKKIKKQQISMVYITVSECKFIVKTLGR